MKDILHGLFIEVPRSIAVHLPWIPILVVAGLLLFYKFADISL